IGLIRLLSIQYLGAPSTVPSKAPRPVLISMPGRRGSGNWRWFLGILLCFVVIVSICVPIFMIRAQPILRSRVTETLSARFKSRVELKELHVWIASGLHVSGKELQIYGEI